MSSYPASAVLYARLGWRSFMRAFCARASIVANAVHKGLACPCRALHPLAATILAATWCRHRAGKEHTVDSRHAVAAARVMPSSSPVPSSTLSHEHLLFCFDVIHAQLTGARVPDDVALPDAEQKYPMFITWNTVSSASAASVRLRGCIGTFEPLPLKQGLQEYSIISAFKDRRFSPISIDELPRLECAISLLTHFEECDDYLDWELGTHGIYIDFLPPSESTNGSTSNDGGGLGSRLRSNGRTSSVRRLSATYLPDVAPDQGWSKVEAIDSAIQKAGYDGKVTDELRRSLHVRRYRSEKASVRYAEWKAARKLRPA